jgi:hypothetical protein
MQVVMGVFFSFASHGRTFDDVENIKEDFYSQKQRLI